MFRALIGGIKLPDQDESSPKPGTKRAMPHGVFPADVGVLELIQYRAPGVVQTGVQRLADCVDFLGDSGIDWFAVPRFLFHETFNHYESLLFTGFAGSVVHVYQMSTEKMPELFALQGVRVFFCFQIGDRSTKCLPA